jgi:6-phosphogluconolactonase (cycloisomerase 2 family)
MMVEKIIYVGCYTEIPYAPEQTQNGIYVVKLKEGNLEIVSKREEKNVTYFLIDKHRSKLYAVSEATPPISALHRFDIDGESGELSDHIEFGFQESGACYIGGLSARKGALLAIAFYDSGVVRMISDESDMLTSQPPIIFSHKSEVVKDRQSSAHPHAVYPLKTGDEFLVPDLGADTLYKVSI